MDWSFQKTNQMINKLNLENQSFENVTYTQ